MAEQTGPGHVRGEATAEETSWRVVRILDEYRIAVNAGRKQGLQKGDELEVVGGPVEIIDPLTSKSLGALFRPKGRLKVLLVEDEFCIAENAETYEAEEPLSPLLGYKSLVSDIIAQTKTVKRRYLQKLPVRKEDISGGWQQETIKIGDYVRKIQD